MVWIIKALNGYGKISKAMTGLVICSRYIYGLSDLERSRLVIFFLFSSPCGRGGLHSHARVMACSCFEPLCASPIYHTCSAHCDLVSYFWRPPLVRQFVLRAARCL